MSLGCSDPESETPQVLDGQTCIAPSGVSNAPTTIKEALDLIDSLPRPVTVPCFIDSLARPLKLIASSSPFSAQPAFNAEAPRVFVVIDTLIISWVPDGDGSKVLEFAEERDFARSVKAELHMPVTGEMAYADAFDHLLRNEEKESSCGICHGQEERATDITYGNAFMSLALKPRDADVVNVARMRQIHEACDGNATPGRCAIYEAMFRGDVEDTDFGRALPTFF